MNLTFQFVNATSHYTTILHYLVNWPAGSLNNKRTQWQNNFNATINNNNINNNNNENSHNNNSNNNNNNDNKIIHYRDNNTLKAINMQSRRKYCVLEFMKIRFYITTV